VLRGALVTAVRSAFGSVPRRTHGSPQLSADIEIMIAYERFTFQKIGAPNLRTSRTFFRNTVGCTHSPQGT